MCNEMVVVAKEIYMVHYIFLFFKMLIFLDQFPTYLSFYLLFPSIFILAGKTSQFYISTYLLKIAFSAIVSFPTASLCFGYVPFIYLLVNLY